MIRHLKRNLFVLLCFPFLLVAQNIEIKGFLVQEEGQWFVSDQPKVKSCCEGVVKPKKTALQPVDFPFEEGKVYTLKGQLMADGFLQVIEVKGDEVEFTILVALIILTAAVSYIYLKKKR